MTTAAEADPAPRGFFADRRVDWGLVVSALLHLVGFAIAGVWFSDARSFEEAQEAIPIEVVTQADLNQITKGEKEAAPAPRPAMKAEREAERVIPQKPVEQPQERDAPTPPPPPVRQAAPAEPPTPPPAPARVAVATPEPPPRPDMRPAPAPPTPPHRPAPEHEPKDAEAVPAPEPPRRPVEPPRKPVEARADARSSDEMPTPPPRPRIETKALAKPEAKPDQLARLIEAKRAEERARPDKQSETQPSRFNAADIRNAITRERPQQRAAAAPQPSQTAALGSPTARAERMSPSMWGQLDGYLQEQYRTCWNKFGFDGQTYIPQIRVLFNADGSLASEPVLANSPGDSSEKALADSAMRAVRRCDPIRIPPQFAPFHAQWKARTLRFDPQEM